MNRVGFSGSTDRRVAITGIGLVTALGVGRDAVWAGLMEGRSGIDRLGQYDPASFRTQWGAELTDFDPRQFADRRALRMTTRNDQLAIAGAALAVSDSQLELAKVDPTRAGLFLGGNKEISKPEHLLEGSLVGRDSNGSADIRALGRNAASAFYPLFYVEGLQSASLFYLSQAYGLRGANAYFHGTADAGATAIGRGYRSILRGESDVVLAGGFDDASSWWSMSKMDGLGVLSTANDQGNSAFRPYDVERSGSLLGEGAAFLMLEELSAARRRGAAVYAELTGFGSTMDTVRLLTPEPSGRALSVAIGRALNESRTDPADVGMVASHGCATRLGDVSETRALKAIFGAGPGTVGTSVKPATGHLVAGAGALNAAVCALSLYSGEVPATLNLRNADPQCDWNWVTGAGRAINSSNALALARGLEGQQVALALSAVAG